LPNQDATAYHSALEKIYKAAALEPNEPAILNALGAAHYRLGCYEDALRALTKAEQMLSVAKEEPDTLNIAFAAMVMHRMGRTDGARSRVERLKQLCKDEFADDLEALNLLAEAEGLIEGKKP
jgi:tetratricopeptide (TPR) repeat protein